MVATLVSAAVAAMVVGAKVGAMEAAGRGVEVD